MASMQPRTLGCRSSAKAASWTSTRPWTNSYDPTERWWGVEVEFPSTLDEVFGVTNTKQNATIFSNMAQLEWRAEANPGESMSEFRQRIQSEGDPRALLLPIVDHIRQQIQELRKRLKKQTKGPPEETREARRAHRRGSGDDEVPGTRGAGPYNGCRQRRIH